MIQLFLGSCHRLIQEQGRGYSLMVQWLRCCDFTMSGLLLVRKLRFCKPCEDKKKKKSLLKKIQQKKKQGKYPSLFLLTWEWRVGLLDQLFNSNVTSQDEPLYCFIKKKKEKYSFWVVFSFCRYCSQRLPICFLFLEVKCEYSYNTNS